MENTNELKKKKKKVFEESQKGGGKPREKGIRVLRG
jgi:hypothetical protein